jgi:hypothetical protein
MKIRNKLSFVVISALATVAAYAAPLLQLENESIVHALADVTLAWEDNVLRTSSLEQSDMYLKFSPGLEMRLNPNSAATTTVTYRHHFLRYQDMDELDGDFADLGINFKYDSGIILTNAYAKYVESYSNTYGIDEANDIFGVLTERDTTEIGANARYELSELTAIKVGVSQDKVDYAESRFSDHDSFEVPVTFFYKIRPKASLTAGARYRKVDTDAGNDFKDMYYFIGGVGEVFSPIIHADISVGYQTRDSDYALLPDSDTGSASYDVSLIYTGNPKATVYGGVSRDYRTSAYSGYGYTFTSATLGARYSLSNAIGVNAQIAVGESEYEQNARAEDITMFNLGASYRANDFLMFRASYSYRDVDGDVANYQDSEFRVTASLRY